jgi:hypothetical protein
VAREKFGRSATATQNAVMERIIGGDGVGNPLSRGDKQMCHCILFGFGR